MEIWKPIKDYEGLYEISNLGRVKSLKRKKEAFLKPCNKNLGKYERVVLCDNFSNQKKYLVHRIVATAFLNKEEYQNQVNHINKITSDNKVENLEWVSHIENHSHRSYKSKHSSKYVGVSYFKANRKWSSCIFFNNKKKHLGFHETEEKAYQARINFELNNNIKNKYV
jgi:hypothetical protein